MDLFEKPIKSGMVAIVGAPNAGKSTLMNSMLGQKISIVTHKAQTTRNRIAGIVNDPDYQIVFLDTPGLHSSTSVLNVEMVRIAMESLKDVDCVLFLHDVTQKTSEAVSRSEKERLDQVFEHVKCPAILLLNKIDLVDKRNVLPLIEEYSALYPFKAVIPVSALRGDGTEALLQELLGLLPEGPRYFPEDIPTDASERFLCAEIIREKVFLQTGQEIPYSAAVLIDSFKEDEEKGMITIHATIYVERDSQKGIVIGKGGKKLKSIGTAARIDIETLLAARVLLKLWVKVRRNWSQDERFLRELGMR